MAKMFYTLEEAAERLGVNEDEIKRLASTGKLQQFRDREKLMYKRDQVDAMATEVGTTGIAHVVNEDDTGPIELADSGADAVDLKEAEVKQSKERKEDPRQRTGVSVFDADEIEAADPMAQTQVSQPTRDEEELVLESVGSGSGLLDLTRESDDTSLGAELLEEIYPGSGEGSDSKLEPVPGSSTGLANMTPESGASGLENLQPSSGTAAIASHEPSATMPVSFAAPEAFDGAGSGLGTGALAAACLTLVLALIVAIGAIQGAPVALTRTFQENLWLWVGVLLGVTVVFTIVGWVIGKMFDRRG